MRVLYIDTSSSYLYSGIVENNNLLISIKENLSLDLSKMALPKIAQMFEKTKIKPNDIDKIIVVNGPGSFTGIRVGLTIAKVYAWSLNIPITTISGLEAMACSCTDKKILVPAIDARRNYSYAAIYDGNVTILEPKHINNEELSNILKKYNDYIIISNDNINLDGKKCAYDPDIKAIVKKYVEKENINPHFVNPNYLKLTEAEESKM